MTSGGVKRHPRPGHLLLEDREDTPNFSHGDEPVVPARGPGTGEFRVRVRVSRNRGRRRRPLFPGFRQAFPGSVQAGSGVYGFAEFPGNGSEYRVEVLQRPERA